MCRFTFDIIMKNVYYYFTLVDLISVNGYIKMFSAGISKLNVKFNDYQLSSFLVQIEWRAIKIDFCCSAYSFLDAP